MVKGEGLVKFHEASWGEMHRDELICRVKKDDFRSEGSHKLIP